MSTQIQITLTPQAQQLVANLQALPVTVMAAIARGLDQANQFALARIQRDHLTGQGPFPVAEHKLGVITSRLRGSANATAAVVDGQTVRSSVGSNVAYAAIHEFGGRIHKPAREVKTRLRTTASGALVRQLGHLAVFAKKTHARYREVTSTAVAHDIEIPERAPFRTGLAESAGDYRKYISAAILAAMSGGAQTK